MRRLSSYAAKRALPQAIDWSTLKNSTPQEIDQAIIAASAANNHWSATAGRVRASLLRALADGLDADGSRLVDIADHETTLGRTRLAGEIARTSFQLRGFAERAEANAPFSCIDDAAVPGAPPQGRPRLTRVRVPVGPVAMFAASNFPFAFSVLGGDTASALAAGCPVVVKAHPGHPQLSHAVLRLAADVIRSQGLPEGVLTMVEGSGIEVGVHLVRHPDIAAVAFTGSFKGGTALLAEANARPIPIPFYGELGSTNPVVILPSALAAGVEGPARMLAESIAQGAGQFCTSPGVAILFSDPTAQAFLNTLGQKLSTKAPHAMLTPNIGQAYEHGNLRLAAHPGVRVVLPGGITNGAPVPALLETDVENFVTDSSLREEVFGPLCVVVRVRTEQEVARVLEAVGGSLTVTIWGAEDDPASRTIVRTAMQTAGRVLFSGVPTGVAVTAAQHHGGPWPASTQPFTTSVGYAAMDRFLRPVALQDAPDWLLESVAVQL